MVVGRLRLREATLVLLLLPPVLSFRTCGLYRSCSVTHPTVFGKEPENQAEGEWAFWADSTAGRYDRLTYTILEEVYLLAAYQDVDVSPFSDAIDSAERRIFADWAGQVLRVSEVDSVTPAIAIEFLDCDRSMIERHELPSQTVGEWEISSSSNDVPPGTRHIRFWMVVAEVEASPANAAWDDLSVILREELPPEPLTTEIDSSPDGATIRFGPTIEGSQYHTEYANDLFSGVEQTVWTPCGPVFVGDGTTVEWRDTSDEQVNPTYPPAAEVPCRFYRVVVQ